MTWKTLKNREENGQKMLKIQKGFDTREKGTSNTKNIEALYERLNISKAFDITKNGPKLIHSVEIAHNLKISEFFCHSDFT